MTKLDPSEAVGRRTFVAAETRNDAIFKDPTEAVYALGRVISYTDAPTYTIERPDGTRFSWRADLCRPATESEVAGLLHEALDQNVAQHES